MSFSRRDFLFQSFKATMALSLSGSLQSCFKKNKELSPFLEQFPEMNYIQLNLYGGPSRWVFDNFLAPKKGLSFLSHPHVGSRFKNSDGEIEYHLEEYRGFQIPILWNERLQDQSVARDLLGNMITIRGIDPDTVGHPQGAMRSVRPDEEKPSLHGLLSDQINSPLPTVLFGSNPATRAYSSHQRSGLNIPLDGKNLIEEILKPFYFDSKGSSLFSDSPKKALSQAIANIESVQGFTSYKKELKKSLSLYIENFDDYLSEYSQILDHYEKLIQFNFRGSSLSQHQKINLQQVNPQKLEDFQRYKVDYESYLKGGSLESFFSSAHLGYLAHQFASMEFLIKKGLVKSFMFSSPNEMGDYILGASNEDNIDASSFDKKTLITAKKKGVKVQMDSHDVGSIAELASSYLYFKCTTGCLIRLKNELSKVKLTTGKTLFDNTLIHITSEFERVPRLDGSGSDHNDHGHTSSFISGSISKFQIQGNIEVNSDGQGTIGTAAKVKHFGRRLAPKDIYRSVCEVMKVKCPIPRTVALLKWDKGKVVASFDELKNVENEEGIS